MEHNVVGWFEIPVTDMDRAKKFYDTVFDINITIHNLDGVVMGWFPMVPNKSGATGSLMQNENYVPSATDGPVLYFSCIDVATELQRVRTAGGSILQNKKQIGDGHGFMALFLDSEGNRIALHSQK